MFIHVADAAVTPALLLAEVRRARAAADEAERAVLGWAATWADAHPDLDEAGVQRWWQAPRTKPVQEVLDDALTDGGPVTSDVEEYEWYGIPGIAWGAAAGFAAANNQSTTGGKCVIRDALILRHRLPRTWGQTMAGAAPAWRARRVAQAVLGAPADVAAFVDDQVADKIGVLGPAQLARELQQAMIRLHAERVEAESIEALDTCHVTVHPATLNEAGIVDMTVRGQWADLVDLDATIARIAAALTQTDHPHATDTLNIRRAAALGVLADPHAALALLDDTDDTDDLDDTGDLDATDTPDGSGGAGSRRRRASSLEEQLPGTTPVHDPPHPHHDPADIHDIHDDHDDASRDYDDPQDADDSTADAQPARPGGSSDGSADDLPSDHLVPAVIGSRSPQGSLTRRRTGQGRGAGRGAGRGGGGGRGAGRGRDVTLYLHLTDTALLGFDSLAHDDHGRVFLAQTIAAWCGRPDTRITVRPVIDLNHNHTRSHDRDRAHDGPDHPPDTGKVSPALAEHVALHDPTCVYPWCTRPARSCDKDHLLAHTAGGPTCLCNLAPLCRSHHQLKTHAGWTYERIAPRHYLWRDPHGLHYLHTPHGTRPLNGDPPPAPENVMTAEAASF